MLCIAYVAIYPSVCTVNQLTFRAIRGRVIIKKREINSLKYFSDDTKYFLHK